MLQATHDAPSVFFYVVVLVHPFFVALFHAESMVGWAGLTSVRPVSCNAGIPTPVQLTTQECRDSSGEIFSQLQEKSTCITFLAVPHRESFTNSINQFLTFPHLIYLYLLSSNFVMKVLVSFVMCCYSLRLLRNTLINLRGTKMKNKDNFPVAYSANGNEKIIRVAQAAKGMADILAYASINTGYRVNPINLSAIFDCFAEQLEDAIGSNEVFSGDLREEVNDAG